MAAAPEGKKCSLRSLMETAEKAVKQKKKEESGIMFDQADKSLEHIPKFHSSRLVLGRFLGRGGFSLVREVTKINRGDSDNDDDSGTGNGPAVDELARNSYRKGSYAMKLLHPSNRKDPQTYIRGVVDIVMEARFLSTLSHPNIISLRGISSSMFSVDEPFFLVVDTLRETLPKRLLKWKKQVPIKVLDRKGIKERAHLMERLEVASDVASAVEYMHANHIVYRDVKPENVGFDELGDVKLFDLGLAKELDPSKANGAGMYKMTGDTGSPRYMDPLVALGQPYNELVDVYSFSILLWELMALETPFKSYSVNMFHEKVVKGGGRPLCDAQWPGSIVNLMKRGWGTDIKSRLTMTKVSAILAQERDAVSIRQKKEEAGSSSNEPTERTESETSPSLAISPIVESTLKQHNGTGNSEVPNKVARSRAASGALENDSTANDKADKMWTPAALTEAATAGVDDSSLSESIIEFDVKEFDPDLLEDGVFDSDIESELLRGMKSDATLADDEKDKKPAAVAGKVQEVVPVNPFAVPVEDAAPVKAAVEDAATVKNVDFTDIEAGLATAGTKQGTPAGKEATTCSSKSRDDPAERKQFFCGLCFCLILVILAVAFPVVFAHFRGSNELPSQPVEWVNALPADFTGPEGSGFGTTVSLDANLFAAGAPFADERGAVYTGAYLADAKWEYIMPALVGEAPGDSYGAAVDLLAKPVPGALDVMVVGAPMKENRTGAAYFYSSYGVAWVRSGDPLRGAGENEEFGSAVAVGLANVPRILVGAPKAAMDAGRVYSFKWTGVITKWMAMETMPLSGKNPDDRFGASVAVTNDGSRFIVGAPGNPSGSAGYFQIYDWDNTQWTLSYEQEGIMGEALGSSVVVLSEAGDIFAVGGPGFQNDAGRVTVYQRKNDGAEGAAGYVTLGAAVVGDPGDRIGLLGTLSGGADEEGIVLILGTAAGIIKTLRYNPDTEIWEAPVESLETGSGDIALSYSVANGLMLGSGDLDQAVLYEQSSRAKPHRH